MYKDEDEVACISLPSALDWQNVFNSQCKENSGKKGQGIFFLFQSAEIMILKEVKSVSGSTPRSADTIQHDQFYGIVTQHPSHEEIYI